MCNVHNMTEVIDIKRIPVATLLKGEFLDGRTFFIPDYQRGYRWTSQQVEELLQDLLTFAINEKSTDAYYCLQPIVVRNDIANKRLEVIDGQQRLTTLKIILHYLEQQIGSKHWNLLGVSTYPINYATRVHSNLFIEQLEPESERKSDRDPIDYYYMREAYFTVKDWFEEEGSFKGRGAPTICERLHEARDSAWNLIKDILVREAVGHNPTVQVLWYEVDEGESSVKLFNRLNTGKLELTDAELIKGLFLLKTNFAGDDAERDKEQFRKALKWERMENALHDDSFWSFLTPRRTNIPNRIDLLLELVYCETLKSREEAIESIEAKLCKKHAVFNHYNDLFNLEVTQRQAVIESEWVRIEKTFSILEDWYSEPMIYNLIGYLCQTGISKLPTLYFKYCEMRRAHKSRNDFITYLKALIRDSFNHVPISRVSGDVGAAEHNYTIDLSYDDHSIVFNLLLLLNVDHLNRRASELNLKLGELEMCKFPFAVLADSWDIEHVDSQTENELRDPNVRKEWIETARVDLKEVMTAEQMAQVERLRNSTDVDHEERLIQYLRCEVAHEEELDEEAKNNISNLVLLDASTNRSYKNSLFVSKRKKIIARREGGQYVPETTSYVFFKLFEKSAQSRWRWGKSDMQVYANYIVDQLMEYLPVKKEEQS